MALEVRILNTGKVCLRQTSSKENICMSLGLSFDIYAHSVASCLQH